MSQYTEEEIDRIIDKCESLIPDDGISTDGSEKFPRIIETKKIKSSKSVILTNYRQDETETVDSDDYFENFFQVSKEKKNSQKIPEVEDFSTILNDETTDQKPHPEDAILVNNMLRKRLILFRKSIQQTIRKVDDRLKTLENFLDQAKSNDVKDALSFKTTYIKCGRPYFKDALYYPAPENEDYKYRKCVLNEMFPFDLPQNAVWKTKEKVQLVTGIKNQMINHIKLQQSRKICQETKTRKKVQKLRFVSNNSDLNEMTISNLYETIQNDYPDFQISWNMISFNDLQSTHSVTECMGMWYSYLKPDINREATFTDEENATLSHLATENNYQNWEYIAQQLDRRTSLQTFCYFSMACSRLCPPNVRWTPEEDELLLDIIRKCTNGNSILWNKIGALIPNRNKTQCYNRYLILNKSNNMKKGVFSPQENRILLQYVEKYGTDFNRMPQSLLPHRSIIQIKNHYNVALKHKGKVNPWTLDEDKKLMEFVENEGTNNWKKISDILETHNRLSCRTRYLTISKFLSKNPNKSIKDVPSRLKNITAVHKAVLVNGEDEKELDEDNNEAKQPRTKGFGLLSFEEFKTKNVNLYNLMKISYNYKLISQELNIDYVNFLIMKSLLNVSHYGLQRKFSQAFTPNQYDKINEALSETLHDSIKSEIFDLRQNLNFLVPLSYYTCVGLRSVSIKVHEEPVDPEDSSLNFDDKNEAYCKALKRFQQFFISLFYWPAMLSKLQDSELMDFKTIRNQGISQLKIFNITPTSVAVVERPIKRSIDLKSYVSVNKKPKIEKSSVKVEKN